MLDRLYECAVAAGARGGKIVGAGGGGFLLLCVDPVDQRAVALAMAQARSTPLPFRFTPAGVEIVDHQIPASSPAAVHAQGVAPAARTVAWRP